MIKDSMSSGIRTLRRGAAHFGAGCVFYSGALHIAQRLALSAMRPAHSFPFLVLLYHRVNSNTDSFFPSVSVKTFEAQIRYLARHFHILSVGEIVQRMHEGRGIEPWTVAITFDDGYQDNYLYAHPILRRYGLPATLFVATGYIGTGRVLWNDRVAWAIKHTERNNTEFVSRFTGEGLPLESMDDRNKAFISILENLKGYPEEERNALVDDIVKELQNGKRGPEPMMLSWGELHTMTQEGWAVGSHTVNHAILTKVNEAGARRELLESKQILEETLQRAVRLFAYPNGRDTDFNPRIKALIRETGYEAAVTTVDGFNEANCDLFEIRRRNPWDEHLSSFVFKLRWSYWNAVREPSGQALATGSR